MLISWILITIALFGAYTAGRLARLAELRRAAAAYNVLREAYNMATRLRRAGAGTPPPIPRAALTARGAALSWDGRPRPALTARGAAALRNLEEMVRSK